MQIACLGCGVLPGSYTVGVDMSAVGITQHALLSRHAPSGNERCNPNSLAHQSQVTNEDLMVVMEKAFLVLMFNDVRYTHRHTVQGYPPCRRNVLWF